ncbi:protein required for normal CLN1 and CLN2 G1 cyclin expression [Blastocladiella emersonii ATCC 22665]|nr:protein required for normal CLN1 and CLN2 G1 cyclin expression [Blastocladiella emersonii ATCC 22665]
MAAVDPSKAVYEVHIGGEDWVDINLQQLPPAEEILEVINDEVDLKHILRLAIIYYKQGRIPDYDLLIHACHLRRYDREQSFQAYNAVVAARSLVDIHDENLTEAERQSQLEDAHARLTEAERLEPGYLVLWVTRGTHAMERGELDVAERNFTQVLSRRREYLPALMGMAMVYSKRKDWKKGLRFWQRSLRLISTDREIPLDIQCQVRVGIGLCFAHLGLVQEAIKAFLRVIDLDPDHVQAYSYISSLYINEMRRPDCAPSDRRAMHANGIAYAKRAYETMTKLRRNDPMVLIRLADILFLQGAYDKAAALLDRALPLTRDPVLLAELYYYKARNRHRAGDYDAAFEQYIHALKLHPEFLLPRFPLAQIHAHRAELSQAIEHLDQIRERIRAHLGHKAKGADGTLGGVGSSLGDDYDTLKLLAQLHARLADNPVQASATMPTREYQEARERSRQLYSRALELFRLLYTYRSSEPGEAGARDLEALIPYARLLETSPLATPDSYKSALELYQRAEAVLLRSRADQPIPPELTNNMGVLLHTMGQFDEAKQRYMRAFNEVRERIDLSDNTKFALETTLRYNVGRACEDAGEINEAEKLYAAVIKKHPSYVDAHLRLAHIEHQRGHLEEAARHCARALESAPRSVEALLMLGSLQLAQSNTRGAKRTFGTILGTIDKFDVVSLLQLGNIWLFEPRRASQDERNKALAEAYKLYEKVLQLDPRNPYAATGLAIALREKGFSDDALRAFEQVREADDQVACFAINYAHMLAEVGEYKRAIPLYEKAQERFFEGRDADLLVATARAYFQQNKVTKSADLLRAAAKLLQRALHIFPKDPGVWFNLTIVLQDHTAAMSSERMDKVTVDEMREAATLADLAIRNLQWLEHEHADTFDPLIINQRNGYTKSLKERLEKRIDELIQTTMDREKRLNEMIQRKHELELQRLQEQAAAKADKQRELEQYMREFEARNNKHMNMMRAFDDIKAAERTRRAAAAASAASRSSRGGRGGGRAAERDDFVVSDDEASASGGSSESEAGASNVEDDAAEGDEGSSSAAKPKRSKKKSSKTGELRRRRRKAQEDAGEDGDAPERKRRKKSSKGAAEDGEAAAGGSEAQPKRRRLKKRSERISSEIIEDSDEELARGDDE